MIQGLICGMSAGMEEILVLFKKRKQKTRNTFYTAGEPN